jgi:hypothetical protein
MEGVDASWSVSRADLGDASFNRSCTRAFSQARTRPSPSEIAPGRSWDRADTHARQAIAPDLTVGPRASRRGRWLRQLLAKLRFARRSRSDRPRLEPHGPKERPTFFARFRLLTMFANCSLIADGPDWAGGRLGPRAAVWRCESRSGTRALQTRHAAAFSCARRAPRAAAPMLPGMFRDVDGDVYGCSRMLTFVDILQAPSPPRASVQSECKHSSSSSPRRRGPMPPQAAVRHTGTTQMPRHGSSLLGIRGRRDGSPLSRGRQRLRLARRERSRRATAFLGLGSAFIGFRPREKPMEADRSR